MTAASVQTALLEMATWITQVTFCCGMMDVEAASALRWHRWWSFSYYGANGRESGEKASIVTHCNRQGHRGHKLTRPFLRRSLPFLAFHTDFLAFVFKFLVICYFSSIFSRQVNTIIAPASFRLLNVTFQSCVSAPVFRLFTVFSQQLREGTKVHNTSKLYKASL